MTAAREEHVRGLHVVMHPALRVHAGERERERHRPALDGEETTEVAPAHRLALCRGEACQARGSEQTYAVATGRWAGSPDVEVDEVFCLGNCALGPSGTLDGALHGRLTPERVEALTQGWSG